MAEGPSVASDTGTRPSRVDVGALLGLVLLLTFLWGRGRHTWYWTDEALSLGISSHPVGQMRDLLAQDTSPPLYHLLLHGWMQLFGSSEASTHTLSLLFALAVVPAALWAGWSLYDRRTGWFCAVLAAVNPFLATYANETRMYALVALLSVLATATFVHAFVHRRRRFLPAFAVTLTLTLYTHYWGLFLLLGAVAALTACLIHASDRRRLVADAAWSFGAVALLFAPWLPTLLHQRAHSAVGWALPPTLELVRDDLLGLVGGPAPAVALGVGAGAALVAMLRRPWGRTSLIAVVAAVIVLVVVAAGWATSRSTSQWHARYLGVLLGPLLVALGAALARSGDAAVAMLAVVGILAGPLAVKVPLDAKSNVKGLAADVSPVLSRSDIIFAPIGTVPLLAHYLPDGLRYATTTGPVADPLAADWTDALERLRRTSPVPTLSTMVDGLSVGRRVLVMCPASDGSDLEGLSPFVELEIRRCLEARDHLTSRGDLTVEESFRPAPDGETRREANLLTKRGPSP
jgi:mannosyltransferase